MQDLRERVAALVTWSEQFEKYEHERWHKLNNDLTPLVSLPERMTHEVGRLRGLLEEKINTLSRDLGRSTEATIEKAIEKAIQPITEDVAELRKDVENLKLARSQLTGAKLFGLWLLQLAATVAAVAAIHFK